MNSQLNKLMTFILPLILLCHSTLQAAGCPCCVVRSCLFPTSEHSAVLQKSCCQLTKVGPKQTHRNTCCSRATRQSHNPGPAESTALMPNDSSDCDCCIDLPGLLPLVLSRQRLLFRSFHRLFQTFFGSLLLLPIVSPNCYCRLKRTGDSQFFPAGENDLPKVQYM